MFRMESFISHYNVSVVYFLELSLHHLIVGNDYRAGNSFICCLSEPFLSKANTAYWLMFCKPFKIAHTIHTSFACAVFNGWAEVAGIWNICCFFFPLANGCTFFAVHTKGNLQCYPIVGCNFLTTYVRSKRRETENQRCRWKCGHSGSTARGS